MHHHSSGTKRWEPGALEAEHQSSGDVTLTEVSTDGTIRRQRQLAQKQRHHWRATQHDFVLGTESLRLGVVRGRQKGVSCHTEDKGFWLVGDGVILWIWQSWAMSGTNQ